MLCNICPRQCNIDRNENSYGYCGMPDTVRLARAALHYWEEPCISGVNGSGAIFFSGCNLRCIYCQNREIALGSIGKTVSVERLAEIMLELQDKNANNINLVTGSHYIDAIIKSIELAKNQGLDIPIVYNTSSYENVDSIKRLEGIIDIYLPDMKYIDENIARNYSNAPDYSKVAKLAIDEMVRQQSNVIFEKDLMKKGVIVRHLVLPGNTKNSKSVIEYLLNRYKDKIYISIMNQYTPLRNDFVYRELNRKVTAREYDKVVGYAIDRGLVNGFIQDGKTAIESFIPAFDYEGI